MATNWLARVMGGFFVLLLWPTEVGAKGFIVVTWGETIREIGPIQESKRPLFGVDRVGYKYESIGVFFLEVATWNGTYCVYRSYRTDEYIPITEEEARELVGRGVVPPFRYRYPLGLLIIPVLVIAVIGGVLFLWDQRYGGPDPSGAQCQMCGTALTRRQVKRRLCSACRRRAK